MRRVLRDHSSTRTVFGLFVIFLLAQSATGHQEYNQDQQEHGGETVDAAAYLQTGHVVDATFENWQGEFLAVGSLAWVSVYLRQRGLPEAKPLAAPRQQTGTS